MSGTAVGKFYGEFGLDIDPFLKSVRDIENETKKIVSSMKPVTSAMEDFGKVTLAAGAAVTGAFALMAKQAADYGDAIRDASIRTGIGTAAMGGLKIAAEQSGATFEDLQVGLKKLAVNADAAAKGSKAQEETFRSMGVAVKDATTGAMRPMSDILGDVSEHFKKSTNATEEAGQAVALFGRNGTQLIEFLELGKTGLQEFQEKAERLGLAIGSDVANQMHEFKDTMNDLKAAQTGAALVIGNALLPAVTDLVVGFTNGIVKIREFVAEHENLTKGFAAIGLALTGTGGLILGLAGLITILPKVREAWALLDVVMTANPIGVAVVGIGALTAGLIYFHDEVAGAFLNSVSLLVGGFGYIVQGASAAAGALGLDGLSKSLKTTSDSIKAMAGDMLQAGSMLMEPKVDAAGEITKMIEAFKAANKQMGLGDANKETLAGFDKLIAGYDSMIGKINGGLWDDYAKKQKEFAKNLVEGFARTSDAADKYDNALQKNQVATSQLSYTSVDAAAVIAGAIGTTGDAWEEANKKAFGSSAKLYNEIHGLNQTAVDDSVESTKKITRAHEDSAKLSVAAYWAMGNEFAKIFDNMTSQLATAFAGMVVHAKFSMDALKQLASNTAESMLAAFMKGLFSPLTNALTKFGTQLGDTISKALGIGGKNAPGLAGAAGAGGAAGTAGTVGGGGLFGLSGAATLGIGAAIAGAALVANHFIGEGRKAANAFTSGSQNQFGIDLGSTFNQFQSARDSGTLTLDQATSLQKQLADLLTGITADADQFATQGKNQKKVVDQFFEQQQQLFGKDWVNLTSQIDASIASLKTQASTVTTAAVAVAAAAPMAGIPDTGRAVSASSIFANAVDAFKSAVERLGGGSASGAAPVNVTVTSSPVFNIEVDDSDLALRVRTEVIPEILKDLQGDVNTAATKLIQIIKPRWDSTPQLGGAAV